MSASAQGGGSGGAAPPGGTARPSRREPPLALAFRLYRHDPTFRGFVEFCVIGAIVLLFVQEGGIGRILSNTVGLASSTMATIAGAEPEMVGRPSSLGEFLTAAHKRLANTPLRRPYSAPLDRRLFKSSTRAVAARLDKAADAYARGEPEAALDTLRDADGSDSNVLMLRGIATLAIPGPENARLGIALLKAAAERGQRQAKSFLGLLYLNAPPGTIVRNPEAGRRYLEEAAEEGDSDSALMIGVAYHFGWSGTADQARAAKYLRMAAAANDREAAFLLAYLVANGIGTERDSAEAERLTRQAAEAGHFLAQPLLGMYYLSQYVSGWVADPEPGLRWLKRAADENGHPEAAMVLGSFYTVPPIDPALKDLTKGAEYYRKCAVRLFPPCLYAYGNALRDGAGTPRDVVKAYAHYRLAQEKGLAAAKPEAAALEQALADDQKRAAKRIMDEMVRDWPWSPYELRGNVEPLPSIPGHERFVENRGGARR